MADDTELCERCGRAAPSQTDDEYVTWEAVGGFDGEVGLVCPACLTAEERRSIDADEMDLGSMFSSCSRCQTPAPDDAAEFDVWELTADGGEFLCPGCLTLVDRKQIAESDLRAAEALRRQTKGGS